MSISTIIKEIETYRNSKVIVYFTSDRQNLSDMIREDIIEICYNISVQLDHQSQIDKRGF